MNSNTALVPPFFTPTMMAFGNFLLPNFKFPIGGLGVSTWRVEGGLWSDFNRDASPLLGLASNGNAHDGGF